MSASDKKQQKKAAMAEGLTQKQQREQNEARSAKQKKTVYTIIGVVCVILAAALLIWNGWNGISDRLHGNAVAATVDGVDYTVGDLQYYYANARQEYYSLLSMYGISMPSIDDGAQWYNEGENKTYADYFRESALSSLKSTAALCAAAKEEGYTLSEEGQATIDSDLAQLDAYRIRSGMTMNGYLAQVFGSGVTKEVYTRNRTNDLLALEFYNHHLDGIEISEETIEEYYNKNADDMDSYDYRYFFINGTAPSTVDDEGNTVAATEEEKTAALAAAKEKADAALAEINAAEDKEAAFIAAAPKYVSESMKSSYETNENQSLQWGVLGSTITTNGSSYASWLKDKTRVNGDVTSIESSSGYFIVMFLDRYRDDLPAVDVRHILIKTDTEDSTEENEAGYAIPTQAARDAAQAKAQEILDQWKAGEATEESFAKLAEEHSEDGRNSETNELLNPIYKAVHRGDMVSSFNNWIFEAGRKSGDVGLVENIGYYSGWHIIYFSGVSEGAEPRWRTAATENAQTAIQSDWNTGLTEAVEAVEADGMKYVGSANTATPTPSASPAESAPVESAPVESAPAESAPAESQSAE